MQRKGLHWGRIAAVVTLAGDSREIEGENLSVDYSRVINEVGDCDGETDFLRFCHGRWSREDP